MQRKAAPCSRQDLAFVFFGVPSCCIVASPCLKDPAWGLLHTLFAMKPARTYLEPLDAAEKTGKKQKPMWQRVAKAPNGRKLVRAACKPSPLEACLHLPWKELLGFESVQLILVGVRDPVNSGSRLLLCSPSVESCCPFWSL